MRRVEYGKTWTVNTLDELNHVLDVLEENEFVAEMSDDFLRCEEEKNEIAHQRKSVIRQAVEKNII